MQPDNTALLSRLLRERILILDGAMGTMIQQCRLTERDFRGPFHDHSHDLAGDNDILSLSRPDTVRTIHDAYFEAGADIVETNTFSATRIAQADYRMQDEAGAINAAAARIARECADRWTARTPDKPRFVAGALGPTNRYSISLRQSMNTASGVRRRKSLASSGFRCFIGVKGTGAPVVPWAPGRERVEC